MCSRVPVWYGRIQVLARNKSGISWRRIHRPHSKFGCCVSERVSLAMALAPSFGIAGAAGENPAQNVHPHRVLLLNVFLLSLLQALFGSLAYGFIPSISTIMVDGYKRSSIVLQWSCILGMVADPIARALTFVYQNYSKFFAARQYRRFLSHIYLTRAVPQNSGC